MGIYDREYYRQDSNFLSSISERGKVCKALIVINVVVFVIQLVTRQANFFGVPAPGPFSETMWLTPQEVADGQIWRLLTYAFLHDPQSLLHIVFNMLFLWWFGTDLEEMYGPREFLCFYLAAAIVGGLAFVGWGFASGRTQDCCIGASGAVTAVMVLFAFHFPTYQIWIWGIVPLPVWLFVVLQVGMDAYVFVGGLRTGVAVTVHLGGAAFGFLYYKRRWRFMDLWTNVRSLGQGRSRPRLRVYREETDSPAVSMTTPANHDRDDQMEAKVDAVLEKVARFGQESLTEAERQILLRASEVYRRRRT
jgi:membrane associated rhomboid family serine protease